MLLFICHLNFFFFPEAPVQGFTPLKYFLDFSLGNSQVLHIFPNESLPVVCAAMCPPAWLIFHFLCGVQDLKGLHFNVAQLILPSLYSLCPLCSAQENLPVPLKSPYFPSAFLKDLWIVIRSSVFNPPGIAFNSSTFLPLLALNFVTGKQESHEYFFLSDNQVYKLAVRKGLPLVHWSLGPANREAVFSSVGGAHAGSSAVALL